jgi:hypothetical protein
MTSIRRWADAFGLAIALMLVSCASPDTAGIPAGDDETHALVVVTGSIRAAPACPIEGAGRSCLRDPVAGAQVELMQAGSVFDSTHTNFHGRFRLSGKPGRFTIRAITTHGLPGKAEQGIRLTAGTDSRLRLLLDTNIRNPLTAP